MAERRKPNIAVWRDAVLSESGPDGYTDRLVAVALSKYSGSTGGVVWPSQDRLAADTHLSARSVRRATERLEGSGWIQRSESKVGGQSWRRYTYRLTLPEGGATVTSPSPQERADRESGPLAEGADRESGKVRTESPHVSEKVRTLCPKGADRESDEQEKEQETSADESAPNKSTKQKPRVRKNGTPANAEALGLVMGAWREQAGTPSNAEQRKQASAAKRVASAHPPERIESALAGLPRLFPYSHGQPWDVFDLERVFSKAAAQGEQLSGLVATNTRPEYQTLRGSS